ncbi:MAG: hemerythrin domain-containing protein, partial [Myxococcales bacterium]|nr:hemerythrin domain-containing protein [Myxococcales bacterium]
LEREHDDAVRCVRELRQTLADLAVAPRATNDSLTAQLRDLEQALEEHVTLENQVLFPRALAASPETSS